MHLLETQRLLLRTPSLQDAQDMFEYARQSDVGPMAGWRPHGDMQESQRILRSMIDGQEVWAIEHKESRRMIGTIGLHKDERRQLDEVRSMGYVLHPAFRGQGLTPEAAERLLGHAFKDMGLSLVSIYHYPFNNASKRVIEKCGFVCEGTLRCVRRRFDGLMLDEVCYSMTKPEYDDHIISKTYI